MRRLGERADGGGVREELAERFGQSELIAVFETLYGLPGRSLVDSGCVYRGEGRRPFQAGAAEVA